MRYGFVLADVHRGISNNIGPAVTSLFPDGSPDTLIILPGGRLNKTADSEFLRNSIYDFANRDNLDAAVVWVSSLTEVQDSDGVSARLEKLSSIPLVTIGGDTKIRSKYPDVSFDGYGGMNSIVCHCIEHHGAKRIAFLRGPEYHISSEERYEAYRDALLAHCLAIDEQLISSPRAWNEGREGMLELLDDRGLVPGKDFDTLITASDLMLFKACKLLEERGFDLDPSAFHFCGFNDSAEAKLLSVPCTTVRLPYRVIAEKAFSTLKDMQEGKTVAPCIRLGVNPVIRKSCGCQGVHIREDLNDLESFLAFLCECTEVSLADLRTVYEEAWCKKDERSVRSFLRKLCNHSEDLYAINEAIENIPHMTFLKEEERLAFYRQIRYILPEEFERAYIKRMEKTKKTTDAVSSFKVRLLRGNTLRDISRILTECTSQLGLTEAYLVMRHSDSHVLIGHDSDREFSSSLLLPKDILDNLSHAAYVVVPLYTEDEILGHLVLGLTTFNGFVYEEIRSAVSSAVRSSLLFEQTNLAKQSAEKVEYDRTVFFSSVNEKLRRPIADIEALLKRDGALSLEEKEKILSLLEGSHRVMDLALSKTSDLDMNFQIGDCNAFLHQYSGFMEEASLPCLFFDEKRLNYVLSDLLNDDSKLTASLCKQGIKLHVQGTENSILDEDFIERILLLHGGSFHRVEGESLSAELILPYPTLSNKAAGTIPPDGVIATFGDMGELALDGLEKKKVDVAGFLSTKTLPLETVAIWWSPEFSGDEARSCLQILEADDRYSRLPFLSIGLDKGSTLSEAVQKSFGRGGFRILVCGGSFDQTSPWLQNARIATSDMAEAPRKAMELNPSLIFVSNDDGRIKDETIVSFLQNLHNAGKTSSIPVLVSMKTIEEEFVEAIQNQPKTIVVTSSILTNEDFSKRISAIIGGAPILPVYSGAIVKKAEAYLYQNYMRQISRWQIAESVHVSEDYLTSVFKKEIGISPWDYLNRLRIEAAVRLLKETGMTMADVAKATGFQGQAYFCTVFKKIKGISPSVIRKKS